MTQNYQKGRTILGVILAIAVIALLLLLCLYACRSRVSEKVQDIEKAITLRKNLYCPEVPMDIPQYDAQKYIQNGPNGTTIILQNEMETPTNKTHVTKWARDSPCTCWARPSCCGETWQDA